MTELNAWTRQRHEAALEPDLPILDPHHHLWDDERGRYLIHELLEDIATGHNIIATVFIECKSMHRTDGPASMQPVGEVEFVNGIAAMSASGLYGKSRLCSGIVGHADLTLGDKVQPVLEALIAAGNGRLRGIRYGMPWDTADARSGSKRGKAPRYLALDATFRHGFARLQPLGLSFDAWLFHPHDGRQLSIRKAVVRLRRVLECHETDHARLFGGGEGGALSRHRCTGLSTD